MSQSWKIKDMTVEEIGEKMKEFKISEDAILNFQSTYF